MSETHVLYGGTFTRAIASEMAFAEAGVDYELREIDILRDEHLDPEFLKINPAGLVPALITPEGRTFHETHAINLYLADRYDAHHLAPSTNDPDRGPFLAGLFFIANEIEPAMKRHFYPHRYSLREDDTNAVSEQALAQALSRLDVIESKLSAAGPYYLGERFSLVDLVLAYWVPALDTEQDLADRPAILQCFELVRQRPKLGRFFVEMDSWPEKYARMLEQASEAV